MPGITREIFDGLRDEARVIGEAYEKSKFGPRAFARNLLVTVQLKNGLHYDIQMVSHATHRVGTATAESDVLRVVGLLDVKPCLVYIPNCEIAAVEVFDAKEGQIGFKVADDAKPGSGS